MNANELRIGNWVYVDGKLDKIIAVSDGVVDVERYSSNPSAPDVWMDLEKYDITPIPLTPEILEACGFEKDESRAWQPDKQHWKLLINKERGFDLIVNLKYNSVYKLWSDDKGNWAHPRIDYVHQLQNLYFALTGEELHVNLKNKISV